MDKEKTPSLIFLAHLLAHMGHLQACEEEQQCATYT